MAIAADTNTEREPGVQRGRGGFYRGANDVPYVSDPSGAVVKSGERKGQPKRLPYGSPSGAGKLIENTYSLQKWGERMTVTGIGVDLALIADCAVLATMDRDTPEWREAADRVVVRAKSAAQTNLSADRGTHAHSHTEDVDTSAEGLGAAIIAERVEEGERLGVPRAAQEGLRRAWAEMLEREGLEILAVEASCVDDAWRLAGTLDRIARTTRDLQFVLIGGEIRTIPAGTVLVLDVKSGKRKTRPDGTVLYWAGYAVQIASYAQSVPYDTAAETRGAWPWPISQTHALIAHLDVLGAIAGEPRCELVYVDLVAGREHGGECVQVAKAWEARRDVFSIAQLPSEQPGQSKQIPADAAPHASAAAEDPVPSAAQDTGAGNVAPPRGEQIAWVEARVRPEEGGEHPDLEFDLLQSLYSTCNAAAVSWMGELMTQAAQARVPFHAKGARTRRRFAIIDGLVALARAGVDDDETLRAVLATIVGDPAWFTHVPPGALLGSLSATEAATFAARATALATTTVPADVDEAGHVRLLFAELVGA